MTETTAPIHTTWIHQHTGDHSTGLPVTVRKEIRTSFSDYSQQSWEHLDDDQKEWWVEILQNLHSAEVRKASLDSDARSRAEEIISRSPTEDLETMIDIINDAIDEARQQCNKKMCKCDRKSYLCRDRHEPKGEMVPHCPRCEGLCLYCECDDYVTDI